MNTDTIAAISTPQGNGAIGIIRISGPDAQSIAKTIFKVRGDSKNPLPRYFYYGDILDVNGKRIDKGLMVWMKAPHSYTGEDMAELHCHGSAVVLKKILSDSLLKSGIRLALPGEFTKRAYLNNKMDLAQAESVMEIINAETDAMLDSAEAHLAGALSGNIGEIKGRLAGLIANMEAALEFPEDFPDHIGRDKALMEINEPMMLIKKLLDTYGEGAVIKKGIVVLILGRPNAGKSSLLNVLLKEPRAIVTEIPGTTRDIIEEALNIRGIPVRLMDTAGLRDSFDAIESIGISMALERVKEAGLILYAIDSTVASFDEDKRFLKNIGNKKIIVVANKIDIASTEALENTNKKFRQFRVCAISALKGFGIEGLKDAIYEETSGSPCQTGNPPAGHVIITSVRHRDALNRAFCSLENAGNAISKGLSHEFAAEDLKRGLKALGEITGEVATEDILDRIFSEFCIGK